MPSYYLLFGIALDLLMNKLNKMQIISRKREKTTIFDLPTECIQQIFDYIQDQEEGIHAALLVNRYWCRNIVPLLWKHPFKRFSKEYHSQPTQYLKNRTLRFYQKSNDKLLSTLFSCLSEQDNLNLSSQLSQYQYEIPQHQQTLFNYPYFLQEFSYKELELVILSSLQRWYTGDLSHSFFYPQIRLITSALCKLFLQKTNLHSLNFEKNFPKLDVPNLIEIVDNKRPVLSQLSRFSFTYSEPVTKNMLNFLRIISTFCVHINSLEIKLKSAYYNVEVMEAIVNIIKSQNNLTHFSIEDVKKNEVEPIIFSLKNHAMKLISLSLSHVQLTESCIEMISQFNNLNLLRLDNCKGLSNKILYSNFFLCKLIINSQQQDIILPLIKKFGKNLKYLGISIYDLNIAERLLSFCPHINKIYLNIYIEEGYTSYEELKEKGKSWVHIIKTAYPNRNISLSIGY